MFSFLAPLLLADGITPRFWDDGLSKHFSITNEEISGLPLPYSETDSHLIFHRQYHGTFKNRYPYQRTPSKCSILSVREANLLEKLDWPTKTNSTLNFSPKGIVAKRVGEKPQKFELVELTEENRNQIRNFHSLRLNDVKKQKRRFGKMAASVSGGMAVHETYAKAPNYKKILRALVVIGGTYYLDQAISDHVENTKDTYHSIKMSYADKNTVWAFRHVQTIYSSDLMPYVREVYGTIDDERSMFTFKKCYYAGAPTYSFTRLIAK